MIVTPSEFRSSYRKLLRKNDFVVLGSMYGDVTTVCISYDDSLKTMLKNTKLAHAEGREYLNEN